MAEKGAIRTLPNTPQVQEITYTPLFSAVCAEGGAPFGGTLQITFQPGSKLLEFESFETWLRAVSNRSETIESFARLVFDTLVAVLEDPVALCVRVLATTQVHAPVTATIKETWHRETKT